jgi:hypothetical protein
MKRISYITILVVCLALACLIGAVSCSNQASAEAQKAALRANDIATCNNLMGLHVWYHAAFMNDVELEKCWVKTTPDPVWAQNSNYWIGMDSIKAYYGPKTPREQTKSQFQFHAEGSGVVEIAEDRKTAKGVWYTNGAIGGASNKSGMYERYALDFANENGEWKIWHLHVYTDFSYQMGSGGGGGRGGAPGGGMPQGMRGAGGPAGAPGGASTGARAGAAGGAPTGAPTGAPGGQAEKFGQESAQAGGGGRGPSVAPQATADPGYKEVSEDSYADLIPRPPEPYKTFADTWSYGDPNEVKMFSGEYKEWSEIKAALGK